MPRLGDIEKSNPTNAACVICSDPAFSIVAEWPLCQYCKQAVMQEFGRKTKTRTRGFGNGKRKIFFGKLITKVARDIL